MPHKCPHDLEKRQGEWRPEKQYLLVRGVICEPREEASRVGCLVAFYAPPPRLVSANCHPPAVIMRSAWL